MRKTLTFMMLLLAAGWLLGGCSSEETAPHDPLPEVTDEDVAGQSGYMVLAIMELASLVLDYGEEEEKADASNGRYSYFFGDDGIQGTVQLLFKRNDEPSSYEVADYAQAWTEEGLPLRLYPIEGGIAWLLDFTMESAINQSGGTSVLKGSGTLTVGNYVAVWTVEGFNVGGGSDWPTDGRITFTNEGITAIVTFDGSNTATVTVGNLTWSVNLENGHLL